MNLRRARAFLGTMLLVGASFASAFGQDSKTTPGVKATAATPSSSPTTVLATTGNKDQICRILVAKGATEAENYAAAELALHLGRMLGGAVPVITEGDAADVARQAAAQSGQGGWILRLAYDPTLGSDSYRLQLKPTAKELLITGGRSRGVLLGVYGLLADHLGCRWYTTDVSYVPSTTSFALPSDLNESVTPRLEYRATDWGNAQNGDWAARNRLNSMGSLGPKHGGGIVFSPFVHTFDSILNPGALFATHPEYFSMVGGKRISTNTQLCLSNKDVLAAAIAKAKEWAKAGGGTSIVSVSQCDWENPCECPECKAIDDAEGCKSASLIRFINQVAEAVEKEYPKATIETLAYLYSRKPPKTLKPRHNVIVRLCSIECCFAHPLDGCPEKSNVSFVADLKGWHKLTDRLYIWDYTTEYCHVLMPFPNLDVLDRNMRTFADNGVKGVFEEGTASNAELSEMKSWILAQLMWNPSLDDQALQHEYVSHVYGPCAKTVQEFLDLQRAAIVASGEHIRIFESPQAKKYLNDDELRKCDAKLEEAEQIAKKSGDTALINRIAQLRAPIWYTRFIAGRESPGVLRMQAARLLKTGRELGFTAVHGFGASWGEFDKTLEERANPFHTAAAGLKLEAKKWDNLPANLPFLKSVFFRDGANMFGVWDTRFDDKKGTMESWVWCGTPSKTERQGEGMLFEIRNPNPDSGHRVWIEVDADKSIITPFYETRAGGKANRITGAPMKPATWHHISATWQADGQSGTMNLYVDGQLAGKAPYVPTDTRDQCFWVGCSDPTSGGAALKSFGPIDEVRLSNVVRTPAATTKPEPRAPYQTDANTLLLLHFDEPAGQRIKDSSGIAR